MLDGRYRSSGHRAQMGPERHGPPGRTAARPPIYSAAMTQDAGRRTRPDRVRLGIVGLGAVAQAVHLPLLDRMGNEFEIAAVCDLSATLAARLGERYRVPTAAQFTDAGGLLADGGLDAVAVLSSGAHGRVATAVL